MYVKVLQYQKSLTISNSPRIPSTPSTLLTVIDINDYYLTCFNCNAALKTKYWFAKLEIINQ